MWHEGVNILMYGILVLKSHQIILNKSHSNSPSTFNFELLLCRKQVQATKAEAQRDGITVPTSLADYCIKTKVQTPSHSSLDMADFYDDDDYADDVPDDDDDEDDDDCYYDDEDDSGNGES